MLAWESNHLQADPVFFSNAEETDTCLCLDYGEQDMHEFS